MKDYLSSVIQNSKINLERELEYHEWIAWAKKKIDWYDPFIQAEDEILNDSDRQRIAEILIQINKI